MARRPTDTALEVEETMLGEMIPSGLQELAAIAALAAIPTDARDEDEVETIFAYPTSLLPIPALETALAEQKPASVPPRRLASVPPRSAVSVTAPEPASARYLVPDGGADRGSVIFALLVCLLCGVALAFVLLARLR